MPANRDQDRALPDQDPMSRGRLLRGSAVPLVFLHRLPRWVLPIGLAALLLVGLFMTGWLAAIPLLLLIAFLGWFAYLSWPALDVPGRLLRIAACTVLLAFAGGHILGQF